MNRIIHHLCQIVHLIRTRKVLILRPIMPGIYPKVYKTYSNREIINLL